MLRELIFVNSGRELTAGHPGHDDFDIAFGNVRTLGDDVQGADRVDVVPRVCTFGLSGLPTATPMLTASMSGWNPSQSPVCCFYA